jgi:hypothetical protein
VLVERGSQFLLRKRIELFERHDGGARVAAFLAFRTQLVNDLARGYEHSSCLGYFVIGNHRQKLAASKILYGRHGSLLPQHIIPGAGECERSIVCVTGLLTDPLGM